MRRRGCEGMLGWAPDGMGGSLDAYSRNYLLGRLPGRAGGSVGMPLRCNSHAAEQHVTLMQCSFQSASLWIG